ncbi:hypothetical protein QQF64_017280 [Cirrhinus molitorella]|uniref:E3 ubiquitin-protein ligase n=1 Tax=Cirrhinus molitorella TaxID=172907 RepID=A0ABR3LI68_9TELE
MFFRVRSSAELSPSGAQQQQRREEERKEGEKIVSQGSQSLDNCGAYSVGLDSEVFVSQAQIDRFVIPNHFQEASMPQLDVCCPFTTARSRSMKKSGEDIVFLATDINLPGAVDWVMMQSCFGHHFMLVLEKQEKYEGHQQFFAIVLLIGTRKQAENFAYRLELNGNRRRLTWEATPRSIHDGVAAAIMNSDCLVFDTSIAHLFADNGNLGINVTISMC